MFNPDYTLMIEATRNRRPDRLPLYEHIVAPSFMEKALGEEFAGAAGGSTEDLGFFFDRYCRFFREMTYDTVPFEAGIAEILPDHGAIYGGRPGPVQNREDFERYPWNEIPDLFRKAYDRQYHALAAALPTGMKALGGVGYGVFEISEDLVGYEQLSYMQVDDPELFADLYRRIGDLMLEIWRGFLDRWAGDFAVCRFGDDLGYKAGLLTAPATVRQHIIPQYRRLIRLIHDAGKPLIWHSCGNIFEVMDDVIDAGIDAKHSNEDVIAPFDEWIGRYSDRIALFGGIDMDLLCREKPDRIREKVIEDGRRFRDSARGYALGSGNSIPRYVPVDGYLAMIEGVKALREESQL